MNAYGPKALGTSPYSTAIAAWCQALKDGKQLRSDGDGEQTRDMVYIDDIVQANYLAGRHGGKLKAKSVNIATGKAYSNNQILKMLNKHIGDLNIKHAPKRKGDVRDTLGDTKRAEDILDFKAETSLKLGLKKTLEWWELI